MFPLFLQMYLTRAAGIETDFEYLFAFYFWKMYLTRVAGMSLRLPCKAVRNRKTLRQFVGAGLCSARNLPVF